MGFHQTMKRLQRRKHTWVLTIVEKKNYVYYLKNNLVLLLGQKHV
jgi:hypothetical protein